MTAIGRPRGFPLVRRSQTKGAATDMFDLQPPRHISTLRLPADRQMLRIALKPSSTASSLLASPDPRHGRVLVPISPPVQPCAIGYFAKISSTHLNALSAAACGVSPSFMIAT